MNVEFDYDPLIRWTFNDLFFWMIFELGFDWLGNRLDEVSRGQFEVVAKDFGKIGRIETRFVSIPCERVA